MADRCSFRSGIISGWLKTWTEIYAGTCFYLYLHYLLIHSADVHRCLSLPGSSCSGDRGDDCFDLSDLRKYKKRNLCYDGNDIRRTDRRRVCDSIWKNNQNHRL